MVLKIRQSTIFLSSVNEGDVSESLTNTDICLVPRDYYHSVVFLSYKLVGYLLKVYIILRGS